MEPADRIWCTKCNCFRPGEDFQVNKQGKQKKTCCRHEKKRVLEVFDHWDSFIAEIRAWNQPYVLCMTRQVAQADVTESKQTSRR
jgi:hypothetical protein